MKAARLLVRLIKLFADTVIFAPGLVVLIDRLPEERIGFGTIENMFTNGYSPQGI